MKKATNVPDPGTIQLMIENKAVATSQCGRLAVPGDFALTDAIRQDVTPEVMASRITDLLGPSAATAAAWCALSAYCEGDDADYQFWFSVFRELTQPV